MIPQELKIFRRLEGGKSQKEVLASCTIGLSTVSDLKGQKNQLVLYLASTENVNQHSYTGCLQFIAVCCEVKPKSGPVTVEKAEFFFYDEMSVTEKCTFSEDNNKKITVRT